MKILDNVFKVAQVFSITGKYLLLSQRPHNNVVDLKERWSQDILKHFNINLHIIGQPDNLEGPLLFLGNHVSYLDIPILINSFPEITFVSKKEVKHWPVIGSAAKKMKTIFVERSNTRSRSEAKDQIAHALTNEKKKVAIFPSGTTSMGISPHWKKGAFEIAEQNEIRIQPFRIHYHPLRSAAYIGQDNLLKHMYDLFKLNTLNVSIEFHSPVAVNGSITDCGHWKKWSESSEFSSNF